MVQTQFENFQNSKLCFLQAFDQTRVGLESNKSTSLLPTVTSALSLQAHLSPNPCQGQLTRPSPSSAVCATSHDGVEEKRSSLVTVCLHCSPSLPSSPCDASTPPTSPHHLQREPMPQEPSLPLEQDQDHVTAMPRPRSGHPVPGLSGL
jgi:hypothetical protein